jgi:hypothetical protein
MNFWTQGRATPYLASGIARVPCVRCGQPSLHQWQVCADGRKFRALCLDCDIALNRLVLEWANDPHWKSKCDAYELRARRR